MVEKINNFNDKYNISINIVNEILYLDINNHINNTNFNLIFNSIDLKNIDIHNINTLYLCLLKCFVKANNYNIFFYEHSTELIIDISFIDDDEYTEKSFKLYLTYYNDYYEKIIEKYNRDDLLKKSEIKNNDDNVISENYFSDLYNYFFNIVYFLKILCIDDNEDIL